MYSNTQSISLIICSPVTILSFFATFIYLVNKPFVHISVKQPYMFVSSYIRISFSSQLATYIFQYPIEFVDHQFPYNYSILLCYHHFFNTQIFYPYFTESTLYVYPHYPLVTFHNLKCKSTYLILQFPSFLIIIVLNLSGLHAAQHTMSR
jgi:hypothetical protein